MAGNPPDSPWHNGGSRAQRKRPKIELSLSPEAHEALAELAALGETTRSAIVEALVLRARARKTK